MTETNRLDRPLAAYCSPALAGVKPASLVACDRGEFPDLPQQLERYRAAFAPRDVRFEIVCACRGRFLLLVYRRALLEQRLADPSVQRVLRRFGYPAGQGLEALLRKLRQRIAQSEGFPHEIGLFLGYPLGDVAGFIRHGARDCKCCGCWKVYGNECEARRTFARFHKCSAVYARLWQAGRSVGQLTVKA